MMWCTHIDVAQETFGWSPLLIRAMTDANASGYVLAIAGIVNALIAAYEEQEPVNMTRLKNDVAKQFRLPSMPKLVDIISAVPEDYKDKLLPFLKAKPVRTASGIAVVVRGNSTRSLRLLPLKTELWSQWERYLTHSCCHLIHVRCRPLCASPTAARTLP